MKEYLHLWAKRLQEITGFHPDFQEKVVSTIFAFLFLWLVNYTILKLLNKSVKDDITKLRWEKSITPIYYAILIFTVGRIWILAFHSLANYLGLVSAGIAIALKDPLVNVFAYTYIIGRKPFSVGDRVMVDGIKGDVIDVKLFQFSVMEIGDWVKGDQTTGRIVQIPNGHVFTKSVTNYSDGFNFIWEELNVLITFESDWQKTKEILQTVLDYKTKPWSEDALNQIKKRDKDFLIFNTTTKPTLFLNVEESGVNFTMRYMVNPRKRRWCQQIVWEEVLLEFAKEQNIDLAYPTTRFYAPKK